jgi:uncharacterized protein YceK
MLFKQITVSLTLLAVLSGCSSTAAPGKPSQGCKAEAVPGMLGKQATAERIERARQQTGAQRVRVLAPGDALSMEHDPQRLNIEIDEAEVIQHIRCG